MWIAVAVFSIVSMLVWIKAFSVLLEKTLSPKQLVWLYLMWSTVAATAYVFAENS